jgi:ubiquinone/menaquinone biosynthesis C-methylase UbiE
MQDSAKAFVGSVPALYDHHLGPMLFEPYARDLAERVGRGSPERVLEIAAGTGIVTRLLAERLPGASILATDLNQPMLDHAASKTSAANVTYRQADAQILPFDDGAFDAVICQFGVMFFPDKTGAFRAARRVLAQGGQYVFSVWDRIETNDFARVVVETLSKVFPGQVEFLRRTPHGFHDASVLEALLREAGFSRVTSEMVTLTSRSPSAREAALGYCQGTPLRGELVALGPGRLEEATDLVAAALADEYGGGPVEGQIQALVFTASG